jgi:signal transduction histidine kinase
VKDFIFKYYDKLYKFVAKNRIQSADIAERHIHTHLVCVLSTGALMWAYAILAYLTIDHPLPWIVGLLASLTHGLSPLLFRITNRRHFNTNVLIGAGIVHQSCFAFYSGGFLSNIIIWFGILPMIAGVISGRKGVVTWVVICTAATAVFFYLGLTGFQFPNLISHTGLIYAQALITFGWIYVSSVIIWVFLLLMERHQEQIERQNVGIQNLICVITHDISNPLSVVIGRTNLLKKVALPENVLNSIVKISSATNNITEIVNNVRNLYAMELGKNSIEISEVSLKQVMSLLDENFSEKLEAKKIKLITEMSEDDFIIKTNGEILLHQILGNILSNAIKFSPTDSDIRINIGKFDNRVIIRISDKGIGIPKDLIKKLFDLTQKTNRKGTSGEEGTGFGLPIVKTYVEKLDGTIDVESTTIDDGVEHGTTFIIKFLA